MSLPQILPTGTQVVTRSPIRDSDGREIRQSGAVAVVVQAPADPEHRYRVRFADGDTALLRRHELEVFSHHQKDAIGSGNEDDLFQHVIYRAIVGSRAYGLDDEGSDVDVRGVFLPPAHRHWSLAGVPEMIERPGADECYWELERFLVLALKGNPNILEVLFTPLVEHCSGPGRRLLEIRDAFLSRFIHKTYAGYALSQFRRLEKTMNGAGEIRWKHAMHLLRLLLSGAHALRTGSLMVDVTDYRDRLLAVRRGELSWAEVDAWRADLQVAFDESVRSSPLPERPDYEQANAFLLDARRSMVDGV